MVYMFLANGFEEIEALYTVDVLRRAGVEIKTVGVSDKIAMGSHKIPVICDIYKDELDENADFDMIILPGGLPGATNLDSDKTVDKFIFLANERGKFICAICASPFIIGKRGLLNGRRATCFPGFEKELIGATVTNTGCVRDGNIITAKAMGASHEFAIEILSAIKGEAEATRIKKSFYLN